MSADQIALVVERLGQQVSKPRQLEDHAVRLPSANFHSVFFPQPHTLFSVKLSGCRLGSAGLQAVLPLLVQFSALTHLDLSDNQITADDIEAIVAAILQSGLSLCNLNVANNWFGPRGAKALVALLSTGLQFLDLTNAGEPKDLSLSDTNQEALSDLFTKLQVFISFFSSS